ncbi:MAG: prepilin-type N-terminal cleavage/methylation domain-containing protein [Methylocapsa sp.]|nr:prepilin-type N-terminal cleavage/methylation domain-containing protein [Methylocapsa sp.]
MMAERDEAGFTLLEMVCALAVIALLLATVLPAFPRGTSRPQLEAYALKTAAMLKADRNAAIRRETKVATELNTAAWSVRSGASGEVLQLPRDVGFRALIANQCGAQSAGTSIQFLPSGMSCGGTIYLSRPGTTLEIRVTWLTGGVEIVPGSS